MLIPYLKFEIVVTNELFYLNYVFKQLISIMSHQVMFF